MKFSFIDAKKAELPVARLCEKSRETYAHASAPISWRMVIAGGHRIARLMRNNDLKARQKRRLARLPPSLRWRPLVFRHGFPPDQELSV